MEHSRTLFLCNSYRVIRRHAETDGTGASFAIRMAGCGKDLAANSPHRRRHHADHDPGLAPRGGLLCARFRRHPEDVYFGRSEGPPGGRRVHVTFLDGETLMGSTLNYNQDAPGFSFSRSPAATTSACSSSGAPSVTRGLSSASRSAWYRPPDRQARTESLPASA